MKDGSPKIFISYSWSNPAHEKFVLELAERLVSDGVYVTFDKWHLKAGHDKYLFMEQIITDRELDKVLIISDKRYANNANSRFGGIGDEAQILSSAVYRTLNKNRFIPIVAEFDSNGEPYLPTYLQARIYLTFLDGDNNETAYEQLLRNIYDSPKYKMPSIGSTPTFLIPKNKSNSLPRRNESKITPTTSSNKKIENGEWCLQYGKSGLKFLKETKYRPIFYEPHSNMWIGTNDRYGWSLCYDSQGGAEHLKNVNARPIFYDPQTRLWIGIKDHHSWITTSGYKKGLESIKEADARPIFYDSETKMWIGVKDNLGWALCHDSHGGAEYLKSKNVRPIFYDNNKKLWIGVKDNHGWVTSYNSRKTSINTLMGSSCKPIYHDHKTGLWITSSI